VELVRRLGGLAIRGTAWYLAFCGFMLVGAVIGLVAAWLLLPDDARAPSYAAAAFVTLPGWVSWIIFLRWRKSRRENSLEHE
jgi:hypothetical protein